MGKAIERTFVLYRCIRSPARPVAVPRNRFERQPRPAGPSTLSAVGAQSFYVETLGCPKNAVDSDKVVGVASSPTASCPRRGADDADLVVVNTCAFIEAARQESIDTVLALADARKAGRPARRHRLHGRALRRRAGRRAARGRRGRGLRRRGLRSARGRCSAAPRRKPTGRPRPARAAPRRRRRRRGPT